MIHTWTAGEDASGVLLLGLSARNIARFREQPLDTMIPLPTERTGAPTNLLLISGKTKSQIKSFLRKSPTVNNGAPIDSHPLIHAVGHVQGRETLIIGLSFEDLKELKQNPLEIVYKIPGSAKVPFVIGIMAGEHELDMKAMLDNAGLIGPDTRSYVDPKLQN